MWLFSQRHISNPISNYHCYRTGRFTGRKGGTALVARKGIPHSHVDLPPLVSIEATGVCIPIGSTEVIRVSTSKITFWDLTQALPGLESLLLHKRRLRKLWQVTRDPACKTAVSWVAETIRRMTRRKALERWETKVGNWGHTWSSVAYCDIASEKGWAKGTNRCSWTFRTNITPERESQRDYGLFRKPIHISWRVWRKPWATGGDYGPSAARICRRHPVGESKALVTYIH
jgi:hypothetical protein